MAFVLSLLVGSNSDKPVIFSLGSTLGLVTDGVIFSDDFEPGSQFLDQLGVALGLGTWDIGVELVYGGPGERGKFAYGVEFHSAGA